MIKDYSMHLVKKYVLWKNNAAFLQRIHVLSKSFMQQTFLAKICIFCVESTYSIWLRALYNKHFEQKYAFFMYKVHILCKGFMQQFY